MPPSEHHFNMPPNNHPHPNYPRPPFQPYAFQPGLPPNAVPHAVILQQWRSFEKFIHDSVFRAFEQYASTCQDGFPSLKSGGGIAISHTSNKPVGISREEAETLFSTFCENVKTLLQEQSSGFLGALEEHKRSSEARITSSGIAAQDIERVIRSTATLRQEIQSLTATLRSEIKALVQEQTSELLTALNEYKKLTDATATSWNMTAQKLERIVQSIETSTEDFKSLFTQERAKQCSEIETVLAKQLSEFHPGPAPETVDKTSQIMQEIKELLYKLRGERELLLEGVEPTSLQRNNSHANAGKPSRMTRARAKHLAEQESRRKHLADEGPRRAAPRMNGRTKKK
jgi:hypothetical protein